MTVPCHAYPHAARRRRSLGIPHAAHESLRRRSLDIAATGPAPRALPTARRSCSLQLLTMSRKQDERLTALSCLRCCLRPAPNAPRHRRPDPLSLSPAPFSLLPGAHTHRTTGIPPLTSIPARGPAPHPAPAPAASPRPPPAQGRLAAAGARRGRPGSCGGGSGGGRRASRGPSRTRGARRRRRSAG